MLRQPKTFWQGTLGVVSSSSLETTLEGQPTKRIVTAHQFQGQLGSCCVLGPGHQKSRSSMMGPRTPSLTPVPLSLPFLYLRGISS